MSTYSCLIPLHTISATELLQQNIDMQTEFGIVCQEILMKGEAVSEEMVIKMIEDKVHSPEVAHHGKYKLSSCVDIPIKRGFISS